MSSLDQFPKPSNVEILDDEDDSFVDCSEGEDNLNLGIEKPVALDNNFPCGVFTCIKDITKAGAEKEKGNTYFRNHDYDNSIQCYTAAIEYCPLEKEYEEQLATFYGNRAAAYAAEDEFDLTIEDCNTALELKPDYVKVILRRMQAYEKIEKYEDALADAKRVLELEPSTAKMHATINRLEKLHEEKMTKLKDEALGKLKDLGNSLLGNFGLSLDNFKMQQDPSSGSWSIRFGWLLRHLVRIEERKPTNIVIRLLGFLYSTHLFW